MREEVTLEFCLETGVGDDDATVERLLDTRHVDGRPLRELGFEAPGVVGYRAYVRFRESALARGEESYTYLPDVYALLDRYVQKHPIEALEESDLVRKTEARKVREELPLASANDLYTYKAMLYEGAVDHGLTRLFRMDDFTHALDVEASREYIPVSQEDARTEDVPIQ